MQTVDVVGQEDPEKVVIAKFGRRQSVGTTP